MGCRSIPKGTYNLNIDLREKTEEGKGKKVDMPIFHGLLG